MPFIFLDRDGVINRFPGKGLYVTRREDFQFIPQALEALKRLTGAGFEIHVISNQGCVSRGLITERALHEMTGSMIEEIHKHGGDIREVHYCLHQKVDHCECKKPKVKLFRDALGARAIDLKNIYFVGDSEEDIEAAKNLGCRSILVLSGRLAAEDVSGLQVQPDVVKKDLWEAVEWVLQKRS